MKHLIALLILTQTFAAQAVLLPTGSARPVEQANLVITEATGAYEQITNASLTRVRFEQSAKQGFTLEIKQGWKVREVVFNVIAITKGECGETIYHAISPTNIPGHPEMIVTDHRFDTCDYWTEVADWQVQINSLDRRASTLVGVGEPAAIFTPMANQR